MQTAKDVRNELELVRRALDGASTTSHARAEVGADGKDVPSIAVLPFTNRSRDEDDEYFADGLADELLNVLAKIRGLRVAARTSSFQFKGKSEDAASIGRKLNVATLLEGTVRKAGNRVRIAVELVKVADGFQLWSETYDRTLDDIFAVQDDIAQAVVKELRTTLLGDTADSKASGEIKVDVAAAAMGRGENPEAHQLFVQGRLLVLRGVKEFTDRGIELFRAALELDPRHALAWATLSWAETIRGVTGMAELEGAIARARTAAHRALELSPDLAEAHLALGSIQLWYDFDWKGAEASYQRAVELAPGHAEIQASAGLQRYTMGRHDLALSHCRHAVELDPLSAVTHSYLGRVHLAMDHYKDAESAFRRMLELSPDFSAGHLLLAMVYEAQGRLDEALAEVRLQKGDWYRLQGTATIQHARGHAAESDAALRELTETHSGHSAWQIASAHAARHEADATFEWLERCYAQRDSGLALIKTSPYFRWLYSDSRWNTFMQKIGLGDRAPA